MKNVIRGIIQLFTWSNPSQMSAHIYARISDEVQLDKNHLTMQIKELEKLVAKSSL